MARILIIDDDESICRMLMRKAQHLEHRTDYAVTLKQGLTIAQSCDYDVVILDVRLPDGNGLDALPTIKACVANPEVLIITGEGDENGAELAIKNGAWDYIQKPLSSREITLQLTRALQYRNEKLTRMKAISFDRTGIVGESHQMNACLDLMAQSAATDVNVLIVGETGTGKELFANAIHKNSARVRGNFVVVDCAALPKTLVESVLFGHVKGAFTGATENTTGLIKQADGGTLFLDEVGELPLSIQKTFLRALQEKRCRQVGGTTEINSDFRLIAATHRNLEKLCEDSLFRKDLYYRLKSVLLELPALRERKSDLQSLTLYYINRLCNQHGITTKGFCPEFLEAVSTYDWPGNVRELAHVLDSTLTVAKNEHTLYPMHLPTQMRIALARSTVKQSDPEAAVNARNSPAKGGELPSFQEFIEDSENRYLKTLMQTTGGIIKNACEISKLSRTSLYTRMKKYNIPRKL